MIFFANGDNKRRGIELINDDDGEWSSKVIITSNNLIEVPTDDVTDVRPPRAR